MKVIFLDIDGVFNTIREYRLYGSTYIDKKRLKLFVDLVKDTDCKVVLSSSWRKEPESNSIICSMFKEHDIKIHDCTPIFDYIVDRKVEIKHWLEKNKVEKFAIIDDDTRANIEGHYFKVDEDIGLTKKICDRVKDLLM
jgi:hypothetical protein